MGKDVVGGALSGVGAVGWGLCTFVEERLHNPQTFSQFLAHDLARKGGAGFGAVALAGAAILVYSSQNPSVRTVAERTFPETKK